MLNWIKPKQKENIMTLTAIALINSVSVMALLALGVVAISSLFSLYKHFKG